MSIVAFVVEKILDVYELVDVVGASLLGLSWGMLGFMLEHF